MSVPSDASRILRLTERVRWCDRYRRWVAIATAMLVSPIMISELGDAVGTSWPLIYGAMMSVMLGVIVWWVAEVSLAWLTALWETECDDLVRGRELPRAELLPPRK